MKKKVKLGMIGLGYWGKNILRNLYELKAITKASDSIPETIEERANAFPDIEYTLFADEIFQDKDIDGVVIASPAETHYSLVKEALNAGKNVFVEKPLALTYADGLELVNLAKTKKKVLMVGHILQYHSALIKLKELIDKGKLGKIQYLYSNRLNMGKLRTEENILWSFAPHDISAILMLMGKAPNKVTSFGGEYVTKGIYDTTMTTLEFGNGVKGHIFVNWLHPFKEQKLVVVGTKAMAVFDDVSKDKLNIYPHKVEYSESKVPIAKKAEHYPVKITSNEPLKEELKHFIDCIQNNKKPKTDGEEGLRVLKVLEQAEKSLKDSKIAKTKTDYYVHETSIIDEGVKVGKGSKIWHYSHVLGGSSVGKNCVIGQNVSIGPDVKVGDGCKIQNNVSVYKGVTLEENVFCGPSCVFTNVYTPRAFVNRKMEFLETTVKVGATIGANATIVCGNNIGKYALVAAGAVVKDEVEDYAIVAGVPAKRKAWVCKCGEPLPKKIGIVECTRCKSSYTVTANKIEVIKETL